MKLNTLTRKLFVLSAFVLGFTSGKTQPKAGIFFEITRNDLRDTSYLFGTYHLVNNGYLSEIPIVQSAFDKSRGVVVEIVMDTSKLKIATMAGMMQQELTAMLDRPFLDSLRAELKAMGLTMDQVNNYKPVNVVLTLSIIQLIRNNSQILQKYKGSPLDMYFAQAGSLKGKMVTPLESIEEQMNLLFNSADIEEQLKELKMYIRNKQDMVKFGDELVNSWFAGDLAAMNEKYERMLALSGGEDRLIKQRNLNWMNVLPDLINKESQFIAVGALHLGGKFGMVELLRQKGYTVKPVNLKR